jgi:hypothetical protein
MDKPNPQKPETEAAALDPDPDLVASRADSLTPEEQAAGVEDAEALAETVLGESEARTIERQFTSKEHRRSEETVDPT